MVIIVNNNNNKSYQNKAVRLIDLRSFTLSKYYKRTRVSFVFKEIKCFRYLYF